MSATLFSTLLVILVVLNGANAAPRPAALLVPRINSEDFQLEPQDNKYTLRIYNPDLATREETVEEIAPGVLQVKGSLSQTFADQLLDLVLHYEAGPNGYVAKYTFGQVQPLGLPPSVLKSSVG